MRFWYWSNSLLTSRRRCSYISSNCRAVKGGQWHRQNSLLTSLENPNSLLTLALGLALPPHYSAPTTCAKLPR
jgi:hypothetical protein